MDARHRFPADAAVRFDLHIEPATADDLSRLVNLERHRLIHGCAFDPHGRAHDGHDVQILPVRIKQLQRLCQEQRNTGLLAGHLDRLNDAPRIVRRIETDNESIRPRFRKRIDPVERFGGHQMNFKRELRVRPQGLDQVGEEQHRLRVMPVGYIQMKAFGIRFNALHL